MNVKKIIKGIIGLGAIGGVAYAAYKLGECSGEMNERIHAMADIEDGDGEHSEDDDEDHHLMCLMSQTMAVLLPSKKLSHLLTAERGLPPIMMLPTR